MTRAQCWRGCVAACLTVKRVCVSQAHLQQTEAKVPRVCASCASELGDRCQLQEQDAELQGCAPTQVQHLTLCTAQQWLHSFLMPRVILDCQIDP
eukprot:5601879-Amphidinium_carterae.1